MLKARSLRRIKSVILGAGITLLLGSTTFTAHAFQTYLDTFNTNYATAGTRLDSCGLCHYNFNGGGTRTLYGEDFRNNNYDPVMIGTLDSDGDGFTNDAEAAAGTLTFPGLSCTDLVSVLNAPVDLADYVDPSNVGCITAGQLPIASPNGPYVAILNQPVTLSSAGSIDPGGTIVSYLWSIPTIGTSTEPNPTVTFTLGFDATINVTLTVTDNDGNTDTQIAVVNYLTTPNAAPNANANPAPAAIANAAVQFSGVGSSDPEGSALTYLWDFGDGTTGNGITPLHAYGRCGSFPVTLTVTDNVGLTGTASIVANIASTGVDAPVANAGGDATGHYSGDVGVNIQFDGSASADPDCDIVNYSWDFGDGTPAGLGVAPVHSYAVAGDYVVTLTVTDDDGLTSIATATVTVVDTGPIDGATLYDTNCAACHGIGAASAKVGADVARIDAGIATVPGMNFLATTLSAAQIQAIADYLISLAPAPGTPPDGPALYDTNCAACHGAGAASTKIGADVARIDAGIATVPGMAFLATALTAEEILAIADYLVSLTPPPGGGGGGTDGATLYADNCAACHGPGDSSAKAGATVARINNGISLVASMNFLSGVLSAADIQAIADFLATTAPPGGGEGLYTTNCGACHGADGSGGTSGEDVRGDSADKISSAIEEEDEMQFLSFLTADEVQQISDFLNGITTPPAPTVPHTKDEDGVLHGEGNDTPFSSGCTSCHGINLGGGIGPSCTSCHGKEWKEDPPAGGGGTSFPHTKDEGGVFHGEGNDTPFSSGCTSCHGINLGGGIGPSCTSCHGQEWSESAPPSGGGTGGNGTGQALYDINCGGCHGLSPNSNKAGADINRINAGIASVSGMSSLGQILTTVELQAIADYLTSLTSGGGGGGGTGSDGASLWSTNCAGCHGTDGSAKAGATVSRINAGISSVSSMNYLSGVLSAADIQAIADFLAVAAPPSTPEGLYVTYCAACHGTDASGGSSGENIQGDSRSSIRDAIEKESEMRYLNFLTSDEISAIADHLDTLQSSQTWSSWSWYSYNRDD